MHADSHGKTAYQGSDTTRPLICGKILRARVQSQHVCHSCKPPEQGTFANAHDFNVYRCRNRLQSACGPSTRSSSSCAAQLRPAAAIRLAHILSACRSLLQVSMGRKALLLFAAIAAALVSGKLPWVRSRRGKLGSGEARRGKTTFILLCVRPHIHMSIQLAARNQACHSPASDTCLLTCRRVGVGWPPVSPVLPELVDIFRVPLLRLQDV